MPSRLKATFTLVVDIYVTVAIAVTSITYDASILDYWSIVAWGVLGLFGGGAHVSWLASYKGRPKRDYVVLALLRSTGMGVCATSAAVGFHNINAYSAVGMAWFSGILTESLLTLLAVQGGKFATRPFFMMRKARGLETKEESETIDANALADLDKS